MSHFRIEKAMDLFPSFTSIDCVCSKQRKSKAIKDIFSESTTPIFVVLNIPVHLKLKGNRNFSQDPIIPKSI